jgi:adenine phosphoribosyltransferase
MDFAYYRKFINTRTKGRSDVTPLFANPKAFNKLLADLFAPFIEKKLDKVVGLDALGFILGAALSQKYGIGFVPLRKAGKLPGARKTLLSSSYVDYSSKHKSLEARKGAISKGDNVLIVDDWMETGASMKAAIKLIKKEKGKVIGIAVIFAEKNTKTKGLFREYSVHSIGSSPPKKLNTVLIGEFSTETGRQYQALS